MRATMAEVHFPPPNKAMSYLEAPVGIEFPMRPPSPQTPIEKVKSRVDTVIKVNRIHQFQKQEQVRKHLNAIVGGMCSKLAEDADVKATPAGFVTSTASANNDDPLRLPGGVTIGRRRVWEDFDFDYDEDEEEDDDPFDALNLNRWRAQCENKLRQSAPSSRQQTPAQGQRGLPRKPFKPYVSASGCWLPDEKSPVWQTRGPGKKMGKQLQALSSSIGSCLRREERVDISEAVFSKMDPSNFQICRDNMSEVLKARDKFVNEHARRQWRVFNDIGQEQRTSAKEWRDRRDNLRKEREKAAQQSAQLQRELKPQKKIRIKATTVMGTYSMEVHREETNLEHMKGKNRSSVVANIQRKAAIRRKAKKKRQHRLNDLPVAEREAMQEAFLLYTGEDSTSMHASNVLRCLLELGLEGRTSHEKWVVEQLCSDIYNSVFIEIHRFVSRQEARAARKSNFADVAAEESAETQPLYDRKKSIFHRAGTVILSAGIDEDDIRSKQQDGNEIDEDTRTQNLKQELLDKANHITFEDLAVEIVPAVRKQLDECRRDAHLEAYGEQLPSADQIAITLPQFMDLVELLELDVDIFNEVLISFGLLEGSKCKKMKQRASIFQSSSTTLEQDAFDFETVHFVLLAVEEMHDRARRKREREIQARTEMPEQLLWQYRTELVRMYDLFLKYDFSQAGGLKRHQVDMILKHTGFDPYHIAHANVLTDIIDEVDAAGEGVIQFLDFIVVLERIRAYQQSLRRDALLKSFNDKDRANKGAVEISLWPKLLDGLVDLTDEWKKDTAQKVIDAFDTECIGVLNFAEIEVIAQKSIEAINEGKANEIREKAKQLSMPLENLAQYEWVFDQLDIDYSGGLSLKEIVKALNKFLGYWPDRQMVKILYSQIGKDPHYDELDMINFLDLLHVCASHCHREVVHMP